jgi:hypothetical protein
VFTLIAGKGLLHNLIRGAFKKVKIQQTFLFRPRTIHFYLSIRNLSHDPVPLSSSFDLLRYLSERERVWVEVDGVLIPHCRARDIPAGLYVWNLLNNIFSSCCNNFCWVFFCKKKTETHTKRQATQHCCLPSLLRDEEKGV